VTDVERFFRRLVANLAASDPARLHHPIPLDDIQQSIIPYRANRRALDVETSEDYEMVLLRLCAGEGELVRTEPEEVRTEFAAEIESPNPDLDVLRRFEGVVVSLRSGPLARALAAEPFGTSRPADAGVGDNRLDEVEDAQLAEDSGWDEDHTGDASGNPRQALEVLEDEPLADGEGDEAEAPSCLYCGADLPADRPVRFCPHCGQRQTPPECPRCHTEVDPGWRHCVNCGAALAAG
jgi:hypothetical protein